MSSEIQEKESVMFRVVKSVVLAGSLAVAALFATNSSAQAGGWGVSFGGGYPSYGYSNYGGYGGGSCNMYGGGYGGGYGSYYSSYTPYGAYMGYQSYNTPGSNFRGPSAGYYGHHHHCH
jgi:hypothetical protein